MTSLKVILLDLWQLLDLSRHQQLHGQLYGPIRITNDCLGSLASAFLKVNKRSPLSLDRLPQTLAFVEGRHGSGLNALIDLVCVQGRGSSCGRDPSHCPHFSRLP